MKRRGLLLGLGLVVAGLAIPDVSAAPAQQKEETVTLEISGMT